MAKIRSDFKVRPNTQTERTQENLWDVVVARELVTTVVGKEAAESVASKLNNDPWYMDRGQTRADRYSVNPTVERDD